MPLMLMSNPGLSYALLGNPRGRRVKRKAPRRIRRAAFLKAYRRGVKRVGRTFRTRGRGRYKIESFRGKLARRHHWHVKGIPWSGRRGYLSFSARVRRAGERRFSRPHVLTNPRKHTMRRRRHYRRNPGAIAGYISAAKSAPGALRSLFTGPNKIKHIGFAAGGAVATYLIGGIVAQRLLTPLLARIPMVGGMVATPMGSRLVGGLIPFTIGYVASKFVKGDIGKAMLVGGAAASLVELVKPGMVGQLVARIPGIPMLASKAPAVAAPAIQGPTKGLEGLGGYVSAPSYAGVGGLDGYVSAPSYAGVGAEDDLEDYVSAPSYAGVGADDDLAGPEDVMAGVDGYLDQANAGYQSYLAN
jgi:hypothetical protein